MLDPPRALLEQQNSVDEVAHLPSAVLQDGTTAPSEAKDPEVVHRGSLARVERYMMWEGWGALRELSLYGEDPPLCTDFVVRLAKRCTRLSRLEVSFAKELLPPALMALVELPLLDSLTLKRASNIPDADWGVFMNMRLRQGSAPWRVLCVAECEQMASEGANALAEGGGGWDALVAPGRCELTASEQGVAISSSRSSVALLSPSLRTAPPLRALQVLDMSWCWHVSDIGCRRVLRAAPELRTLRLTGLKGLTEVGLAPCALMYQLQTLDLTSCDGASDWMLDFLYQLFNEAPSREWPEGMLLRILELRARRPDWRRRPLKIRNYYSEDLAEWGRSRSPWDAYKLAEPLLCDGWREETE